MFVRDLIDLNQLSLDELDDVVDMACRISSHPTHYSSACRDKLMATLFYEPSTRTQMSFQSAMLRLGGKIIGFDNPNGTSVAKGESLKDTVMVLSGYTDIITIRNPLEGAAFAASLYSQVPVINAGDGGHLHPTQTLTDIVTLRNVLGRTENLVIGMCGDLKNGRTVHSLCKTMCRYGGNSFVFISTEELGMPQYIKDIITRSGCKYTEVRTIEEAMPYLDVLYMTRIQRERFDSFEEYKAQEGIYVLDEAKMKLGRPELCVQHPLPRVDEIAYEVDDDPRAYYFKQTLYGMYARMALIIRLTSDSEKFIPKVPKPTHDFTCHNPKCITQFEKYLPHLTVETPDGPVCAYCEH
ncbi:MAG: aspartate carbamoyltransferase [Acutalibacteraceae bacterium]